MAREQRLAFGEAADLYDKARPSYPPELVDHLITLSGPSGRVLDIGCGTGKATVLLAARGLCGAGLEPDPEMAALARGNLAPFAAWSVSSGDFEDYEPERAFDLLTCAQAWHWLDPDRRFQHAARLLHPGGWLALFWNRTADDAAPIRQAIDAVYADLFPALSPHGTLTQGRPPAGSPPSDAGFGEPVWHVFGWVRPYTSTEWAQLALTHSDHRRLEPGPRQLLLDRLIEVIDAHGGTYHHPYNCWLWAARRR